MRFDCGLDAVCRAPLPCRRLATPVEPSLDVQTATRGTASNALTDTGWIVRETADASLPTFTAEVPVKYKGDPNRWSAGCKFYRVGRGVLYLVKWRICQDIMRKERVPYAEKMGELRHLPSMPSRFCFCPRLNHLQVDIPANRSVSYCLGATDKTWTLHKSR